MTFWALNPVHAIKNWKIWNQGVKFGQCCPLRNPVFGTLLTAQGPELKALKIKTQLGNLTPKTYPRSQNPKIQTTILMKNKNLEPLTLKPKT